jgi:hypothetical protein
MQISPKTKISLMTMVAAVCLATSFISRSVATQNRSQMVAETPEEGANCIYDPIHRMILPAAYYLRDANLLTRFITAIDAFIIDLSICSLGLFYVITGRTSTFLPTVVAFYLIRTIAINIVTFPLPKFYFFENPGFPSYFVDYDRVNDLYFSGHAGCLMIYIMDCLQNNRKKLLLVFVPFFIYTVLILLVEGIHYTNDIIIGVMCAIAINRLNYLYRLQVNLALFKTIGLVLSPIGKLLEEFQLKITVFQQNKGPRAEKLNAFEGREAENSAFSI